MYFLFEFQLEAFLKDRFSLIEDSESEHLYTINTYKTRFEKSVTLVKREQSGAMGILVKSDLPFGDSKRAEDLLRTILLQCIGGGRMVYRERLLFRQLTVTPLPKRKAKKLVKIFNERCERTFKSALDPLRMNYYKDVKRILKRIDDTNYKKALPLLSIFIKNDAQGKRCLNAILFLIRTNYFTQNRLIDCNNHSSSELESFFMGYASSDKIYLIKEMNQSKVLSGKLFNERDFEMGGVILIDRDLSIAEKFKFRLTVKEPEQAKIVLSGKDMIDTAMAPFERLVGLEHIKRRVKEILIYKHMYGDQGEMSNHFAFLGPPGTGKTTVARLLGDAFKIAGVLKKGHLVETDRSKLVSEYVGKTAKLTKLTLNSAKDGVLFVDEAYSFFGEGKDFGREAIDTITKHMEDHRNEMVMVFAGYQDKMEQLYTMNQGLRSRIDHELIFKPYSAEEMLSIFERVVKEMTFQADERLKHALFENFRQLKPGMRDGRQVRQMAEGIMRKQAVRCFYEEKKGDELKYLKLEDFVNDSKTVEVKTVIGF